MGRMIHVELVCSDESCDLTLEAVGEWAELEALVCDCGCCLQIVTVSEAELVGLPPPALLLCAA